MTSDRAQAIAPWAVRTPMTACTAVRMPRISTPAASTPSSDQTWAPCTNSRQSSSRRISSQPRVPVQLAAFVALPLCFGSKCILSQPGRYDECSSQSQRSMIPYFHRKENA